MVGEMSVAAADEAVVTEDMIAALKGRAAFYDLLAAIYFRPLTAEQSITSPRWIGRNMPM